MVSARYSVGDLRIDVVSDGYFLQDAGGIFGLIPREMWEPLIGPPDERHRIPMALNCVLVRGDGLTVLIDTGIGDKIEPERRRRVYPGDYGHLLGALRDLGVGPHDVDIVVNSHLHFDHCGWNTVAGQDAPVATFPKARYVMQRAEWEAALHPNERTRATYLAENLTPLGIDALYLVEGEHQITPSLRFLPTPGHTDAHAAVVIRSAGETAVYIGDLVQHVLQLERAPWVTAFDILPLVSMETKKRLVAEAVRNGSLLISPHIAFPGAGRMREVDGRPRWEAVAALAP